MVFKHLLVLVSILCLCFLNTFRTYLGHLVYAVSLFVRISPVLRRDVDFVLGLRSNKSMHVLMILTRAVRVLHHRGTVMEVYVLAMDQISSRHGATTRIQDLGH